MGLDNICRTVGAGIVDDEDRPRDFRVDPLCRQDGEHLIEMGSAIIGTDDNVYSDRRRGGGCGVHPARFNPASRAI
jgi:hypothetical protein